MLQTIQYENGGLFVSEGNWIHPTRRIDTTEIIVVKNGQFDLKEDETIYKLKKGDVLQLTRGLLHGGVALCSEPISFFGFIFAAVYPNSFLKSILPFRMIMRSMYCAANYCITQTHPITRPRLPIV